MRSFAIPCCIVAGCVAPALAGAAEAVPDEAAMFGAPDPVKPEAAAEKDAAPVDAPARDHAEDAMFGGERAAGPRERGAERPNGASVDAAADSVGGARDDAVLFGSNRTDAEATAKLDDAYDRLALGGQLVLRADYAALEEGDPETFALSSNNFLDLYADARPADQVRAYVRGRVYHDPTIADDAVDAQGKPKERTRVLLDQLWVKFDLERTVYVTFGQQRIKWGTGRFWNPTDFANQTKLDPLAFQDERTGVPLLKLHLPIESLGWNFYALALFDSASKPEDVGGALRAEIVLFDAEFGLSAAARKDNPLRLGADVSTALWDLDVRGEVAVQRGVTTPFFEGELDLAKYVLPTEISREEDWIPQAVAGVEYSLMYSDQDSLAIGAEYFFNDAGYEDASLYPWLLVGGALPTLDGESGELTASRGSLFQPLYNGRHYGALYLLLMAPGDWNDTTFVLSTLGNFSDRSFVSRLQASTLAMQYLTVGAYVAAHYGQNGELHYGLEIPAIPGAPGALGAGISTPKPALDAGVQLSLAL